MKPSFSQHRDGAVPPALKISEGKALARAERLTPVTIEALLTKSNLEIGVQAVVRGWTGPRFGA